jgi:hypothetical protein
MLLGSRQLTLVPPRSLSPLILPPMLLLLLLLLTTSMR